MNECLAFFLPPSVALAGMRLVRLLLGGDFQNRYGLGFRFAIGLGVGMLVFTQTLLLGVLAGINLTSALGVLALAWGFIELVILMRPGLTGFRQFRFQKAQWWWLLLVPIVYYFWIFGELSLVEGTMEFDAVAHWLIKAKILYFKQGHDFFLQMHNPNLAYVHWDYPLLVPGLYALEYGLVGVDEFVTTVWPVWMVATLCLGILSLGNVWRRPHPLPIGVALILCFVPATLCYIHWEGGTIPMVFYACLGAITVIRALTQNEAPTLAAGILILTGGAMAKFEGVLYFAFWMGVLLPICWQRKQFRTSVLLKAAVVAVVCLVPYTVFRANKPLLHSEDNWMQTVRHSPSTSLQNFARIFPIGVSRRFMSMDFAHWEETKDGDLDWQGHWVGPSTLVNYQLHIVPWLTVLLLLFSLKRREHRGPLLLLTGVVFGVLVVVAFVIASLPQLQGKGTPFILSMTGEGMARYYYPFFMAWFLGTVTLWFSSLDRPAEALS